MTEAARTYCFELVRQADKDRFLSALFAPETARPHLMALYAFNLEVARIRESVSEPALGEIRLAWWRDTVSAIFRGAAADHPVAQALKPAIAAGELPLKPFLDLIESRQFDLYDDPMPTIGDLEGYLGETSSSLIQLAAMILAGREAMRAATPAGLAGVAYGIAGLLRSLPVQRARGQCYVPKDLLARHHLNPAHLLSGKDEQLGLVLADLCDLGMKRLAEARLALAEIPKVALPAFLPASLAELYLARLRKTGMQALSVPTEISQVRKQIHLYLKARKDKF